MARKNSWKFKSGLLMFLFGIFVNRCDAQVSREDATTPPDEQGGDGSAFFALRSCHQLLHGDSGEFFSPDYLCSNPSLWCNWTIQVDPGKRINLHLEDLTSDDACHLKKDQVHVDEPAGHLVGHKVLQKCWREAKYTSSSNTLHVVLLIGGWPSPPYRGFHGHYQAFGPPVVYNPQEGFTVRSRESESPPAQMDTSRFEMVTNSELTESANSDPPYDYYDRRDKESGRAGSTDNEREHQELKPSSFTPTAIRRNAAAEDESRTQRQSEEEEPVSGLEQAEDGETRTDVGPASNQIPSSSEGTEPPHTEQNHPQPNVVEPLSDHRGNHHLFEVAVEVTFSQDLDESWDNLARSLLLSVKNMISKQLEVLQTPLSMSSKRIKRLNAGLLYILWLQIGQEPGGLQVHRVIHSALQGLIAAGVGLRGNHRRAVVLSVSTADVNECGTQLVLCDINADCVNRFGSYSCHCRPGFQDESRLGSGGTNCVDEKAAGCSSGLSSEAKGVYVLFFLLSSLILMLLVAAGMLYRRHHRGTFLVRCHSSSSISPPDHNNNSNHHHHPDDSYSSPTDCDLPPPPPPVRGPREGWAQVKGHGPAVDLPLLRFSPLLPPDSYMDPQEGGKM
ncbi:uncharacterized protein LOC103370745 [Stegastes partitus]|uniref:Uncharacterized protein LOC103370745 n=1 Tax=Stegastes partitus TaxID=144197 RepID=A0A9Y4NIW0_9TELE|nr:PREDICTED: uncharacterized protein LOC103370745 [Stegastes partitus]